MAGVLETGPGAVKDGDGSTAVADSLDAYNGGGGGVVGVGKSGGSLDDAAAVDETFGARGRLKESSRTGGAGGSRWARAGLLKSTKKHVPNGHDLFLLPPRDPIETDTRG